NDLIKKYGVDATRYLLLTQFPFGNDGDISLVRLDEKYNADLAKGLGNLTSRIITLASRAGDEEQLSRLGHKSQDFLEEAKSQYKERMRNLELDGALEVVWGLIKYCDQYIDRKKPWERESADHVISNLLILLEEITAMVAPFLPETSQKILKQLGVEDLSKEVSQFTIKKGDPLFPRLS
ncbi:MAG: class I tRNA ligase family protein, partial [Patescibacteria group bacterium]